jgi:1,4-dihydroxy-2-naphthoate octaprenyltransferase
VYTEHMEQAAEYLVVINSVVLIMFLIVGLVVLTQIFLLLRHVRKLIEKAEDAADTIESVGEAFRNAAVPLSLGRFVGNAMNAFMKDSKRGKKS